MVSMSLLIAIGVDRLLITVSVLAFLRLLSFLRKDGHTQGEGGEREEKEGEREGGEREKKTERGERV